MHLNVTEFLVKPRTFLPSRNWETHGSVDQMISLAHQVFSSYLLSPNPEIVHIEFPANRLSEWYWWLVDLLLRDDPGRGPRALCAPAHLGLSLAFLSLPQHLICLYNERAGIDSYSSKTQTKRCFRGHWAIISFTKCRINTVITQSRISHFGFYLKLFILL